MVEFYIWTWLDDETVNGDEIANENKTVNGDEMIDRDEVVNEDDMIKEDELVNGDETVSREKPAVSFDDVVRIMASYAMGWSTRGTERNYDSFNVVGALIGSQSGLLLDFETCNRKCKKCDCKSPDPDHVSQCRKNFYGSAKVMEPNLATKLVVQSKILKEQNVDVGVLVRDDDSSTIAACISASDHDILKQSDSNHTAGS